MSIEGAGFGSVSDVGVPRYLLYGENDNRPNWSVHAEPLDRRCRERGWLIAPHTHAGMTQIVYCSAGGGEMTIDGERLSFQANSVLVVPPHRIHGFDYRDVTKGWVVTIESHYLEEMLARAPQLKAILMQAGVFDLTKSVRSELGVIFDKLIDELSIGGSTSLVGAEIQLLAALLLMLRHWPQTGSVTGIGSSRTELVERFRNLIEQTYKTQPSVSQMAAALCVSESQLRQACAAVPGISPIKMLHDRLFAEAKRYLAYSPLSVGQISDQLGFTDISYFSRFFKRMSSVAPSEYRCRFGADKGNPGLWDASDPPAGNKRRHA